MPMVFERFPTLEAARRFARLARRKGAPDAAVWRSAREGADAACFPFRVVAPVVVVERHYPIRTGWERRIERLAERLGGKFAGT